jgi:hypothetical protein
MAIKKCIAVGLEVIFDSQATNRKQEGLPVRALPAFPCHPPISHLVLLFRFLLIIFVSDGERPDVSGPIQSIKMYSHAQCTMQ